MKQYIRWLKPVKLAVPPLPSSPVPPTEPARPAQTRYRMFVKGEETPVNVYGANPIKISISGIGVLPSHLIEGKHFEFIDSN